MNIDFTQLIIAIIGILFTVLSGLVTKYVIPWLKQKNLEGISLQLVRVAYSIFKDGEGKKKFDHTVSEIEKKYGKWFSATEIANAVQSAYVKFCIEKGVEPSPATNSVVDTIINTNIN